MEAEAKARNIRKEKKNQPKGGKAQPKGGKALTKRMIEFSESDPDDPQEIPKKPNQKRSKGAEMTKDIDDESEKCQRKGNKREVEKQTKENEPVKTVEREKVVDESDTSSDDEESENGEEMFKIDPNKFSKLTRKPQEDDYVLVKFQGKKMMNKFCVGKIIGDEDEDGDLEISYLRESAKVDELFVMPNIPDLASVHISEIKVILPAPSDVGTKRQLSRYKFPLVDFSLLTFI